MKVGDLVRSVTENPRFDRTRGLGLVLAVHHDRPGTMTGMDRSAKVKWGADYGTFWVHGTELEVISASR